MQPVQVHDGFVLLGTLAGVAVCLHESRRRGMLDERMLWILAGALVCGAVGARLSEVWRYVAIAPDPSLRGFLIAGGRSILGGLAGAYAGVLLTKRLMRYREPTGDAFAPAVALGMAIITSSNSKSILSFNKISGAPTTGKGAYLTAL